MLGINIGKTMFDMLGFPDDLNLMGGKKKMIVQSTKTLIHEDEGENECNGNVGG